MSADPNKNSDPERTDEDAATHSGKDAEKHQQGPETKDEKADEWGEESFPGSDAPANY